MFETMTMRPTSIGRGEDDSVDCLIKRVLAFRETAQPGVDRKVRTRLMRNHTFRFVQSRNQQFDSIYISLFDNRLYSACCFVQEGTILTQSRFF